VKLREYRLMFVAICLIGVLLIASPVIGAVLRLPVGEQFSELYLLDHRRMAEDYPFNLEEGTEYLVYVGVGNHLASSAYYVARVKLGNQSDLLPNSTSAKPSSLQQLYEYRFFVAENETWEAPLTFSISEASFRGNLSVINKISINNVEFPVNKQGEWNTESTGFYYRLFVELWIFNPQFGSVQFHNRYVGLRLNLTETM
jgi:uncharacterized membrane protein